MYTWVHIICLLIVIVWYDISRQFSFKHRLL
nr:MAG TPA: hypothetical protein [Caudoviricetes sp.]